MPKSEIEFVETKEKFYTGPTGLFYNPVQDVIFSLRDYPDDEGKYLVRKDVGVVAKKYIVEGIDTKDSYFVDQWNPDILVRLGDL